MGKKKKKGGKKKTREWEKSELEGAEGRKLKAMCFTAYLRLGHVEYRGDIKQIGSGIARAKWRAGSTATKKTTHTHMEGLGFTHRGHPGLGKVAGLGREKKGN